MHQYPCFNILCQKAVRVSHCLRLWLLVTFAAFFLQYPAAQPFTDSNLPILLIQTDTDPLTNQPRTIPDEPKIPGTMKLIFRPDGSRNYVSDQNNPAFLQYNGRIGIELRGSTSQSLPKKPYGFTTLKADNQSNNNISLLGMPKENDWVLNALAFDPSLVRDYISYTLSSDLGNYAPRGRYCEVVVNGDYKGLYLLMEKIKADQERVNILKMTPSDNNLPNVSGGYITKADKTTGGDPVAWITPSYSGVPVTYIHDVPKPEEITLAQHNYIRDQFDALRNVVAAKNHSVTTGYPALMDVPSFVDYILINELASNVDAYQFSTFFHKDRDGKLRAGPIWDLNLTYGNDLFFWGYDRSHTNVWQFANGDNTGSTFWRDLFELPTFRCLLARRWNLASATGQPLNYNTIIKKLDEVTALISEAAIREDKRWGTIGDHSSHILKIKQWLQGRIYWLGINLRDYAACANPPLPAVVISKIHYNPVAAEGFTSDELEFIEISNPSNTTIDLSGIYFKELGLTYSFPPNSRLSAGGKIFIAANASAFQKFYGMAPFGQFTRNLSNKSQKLVLADAYGNIIDEVTYADAAPWPVDADGKGAHLQLTDLNADNSLPASWSPSSQLITSTRAPSRRTDFSVFPNPARDEITILSESESIVAFEISDLLGRKILHRSNIGKSTCDSIDLSELSKNLYILHIAFGDGSTTAVKIVKH